MAKYAVGTQLLCLLRLSCITDKNSYQAFRVIVRLAWKLQEQEIFAVKLHDNIKAQRLYMEKSPQSGATSPVLSCIGAKC